MAADRFTGKVAIVTGAGCVGPGWGNGRAIAVGLAREGAIVLGLDRRPEAMTETAERIAAGGGHFTALPCDVTDSAAIAGVVAEAVARHGRIDVLVNNVGGSAAGGPVEMAEEIWDLQVDTNLKSVFLACKHVLPVMEAQGAVRSSTCHPPRACAGPGRRRWPMRRRRPASSNSRASSRCSMRPRGSG
jgi:NAD(P)-dependent dehydrogenase (short-subunit alcohol dehydrogenase family)